MGGQRKAVSSLHEGGQGIEAGSVRNHLSGPESVHNGRSVFDARRLGLLKRLSEAD